MADSYTAFWTNERCRHLKRSGQEGARLEVLFGGPHQSEPSFRRAGVREGDDIYPVRVQDGIVYLLGRLRVRQLIALELGDQAGLGDYLRHYPAWAVLAPTCTSEVVIGQDGTPLRLDLAIPPDLLARLRFRSRRGERGLKHIEDGRLKSSIGLQGIYRLSRPSAAEIEALLLGRLDGATDSHQFTEGQLPLAHR